MLFIPRIPSSVLKHYWCVALGLGDTKIIQCQSQILGLMYYISPSQNTLTERKVLITNINWRLRIVLLSSRIGLMMSCSTVTCRRKDIHTFWCCYRKKNSKVIVSTSHVECLSSDANIVEVFADYLWRSLLIISNSPLQVCSLIVFTKHL